MLDNFEKLQSDVWRTAGARYNAYRRYKAKNTMSAFCIALLSIFNISMSLDLFLFSSGGDALAILVSVFILVVSILEFAKDYSLKSERLHKNAMELTDFNKRLRYVESQRNIEELLTEYSELKMRCPENHEPCDDDLFCSKHPKDFGYNIWGCELFFRIKACVAYFLHTYVIYILLIIIPLVFLFLKANGN